MENTGGTELQAAMSKIGTLLFVSETLPYLRNAIVLLFLLKFVGGFGKYHYGILFRMIPSSVSGIIVVNSVTYILPAIICEFDMPKYQHGLLFSAVYMGW